MELISKLIEIKLLIIRIYMSSVCVQQSIFTHPHYYRLYHPAKFLIVLKFKKKIYSSFSFSKKYAVTQRNLKTKVDIYLLV